MTKKIYLFANWKMYLDYAESVALARALAQGGVQLGGQISHALYEVGGEYRRSM